MPSYEEALRDRTTTAETETTEQSNNSTAPSHENGGINTEALSNVGNGQISYRNGDVATMSNGVENGLNNLDITSGLNGVAGMVESNLPSTYQQERMSHQQSAQSSKTNTASNDDADMVDTPTSENAHLIIAGNPLMPLQVNVCENCYCDYLISTLSDFVIQHTFLSFYRIFMNLKGSTCHILAPPQF